MLILSHDELQRITDLTASVEHATAIHSAYDTINRILKAHQTTWERLILEDQEAYAHLAYLHTIYSNLFTRDEPLLRASRYRWQTLLREEVGKIGVLMDRRRSIIEHS